MGRAGLAKSPHHRGQDLARGNAAGKTVGVGEKIAFQVFGSRVKIGNQSHIPAGGRQELFFGSKLGILDRLGDVEKVEAFGDRHCAGINIAANNAVVHCRNSRRLNELVLSRLERAPMDHVPEIERILAADNAMLSQ